MIIYIYTLKVNYILPLPHLLNLKQLLMQFNTDKNNFTKLRTFGTVCGSSVKPLVNPTTLVNCYIK